MRIIRKQFFFERELVKMDTRKMYDEIVDYFMACGQDSGDWNIDGLIDDIDNKYPDINSIDDIPEDEFTGMLIKHDTTVE